MILEVCPRCERKNYALSIRTGRCAWCGFDINKDTLEEEDE